MDTTTHTAADAAALAGVTVPTVRAWCRIGAVKAAKTAGRWVIDAASLARRIALGIRRTTAKKTETPVENTFACGHPARAGRTADPARPCKKCTRTARAQRAAAARDALYDLAALPTLTGTPKQVEWATRIRVERLTATEEGGLMRICNKVQIHATPTSAEYEAVGDDIDAEEPQPITPGQARERLHRELTEISAAWWIDTYAHTAHTW